MFQKDSSSPTMQNQGSRGVEMCVSSGVPSNTGSAERPKLQAITVVLHAFIEPAHWGITPESLQVEVRCDLNWESNNAEVKYRR